MSDKARLRTQLLIRLGYHGNCFFGVQAQPGLTTVAGALSDRIEQAALEKPRALTFSARTDRGVHALQNYATCWLNSSIDLPKVIKKIENPRIDGLFGLRVRKVDYKVHARGNARAKAYRYVVLHKQTERAIEKQHPFAWAIAPELDLKSIQMASHYFKGLKDFSSFRGSGCSAQSTIKEIYSCEVRCVGPQEIHIDIYGNAFLRKMIRNIVGTLVEVGAKWRPVRDVPEILEAKSRQRAGITAPAHGLTLMKVDFEYET